MNRLRELFIIGFYNILRFCSIQLQIIGLNFLLMVTLNHRSSQNGYWKCLSMDIIIVWQAPQKKADLRRQEMQNRISSSVILLYAKLCHPNPRRCLHGTRSCVVVSVGYLPIVFIHHYFHGVIIIWRKSKIQFKILKIEGSMKNIIAYLRHMKFCDAVRASYICNVIWNGHG